jgi:AraC-like DNA-binding protein
MSPQMIDVQLVQNSGDWQVREMSHAAHEIVYVLTPGYRVRVGSRRHTGSAGDLFLYPKGSPHTPLLKQDLQVRFYVVQWKDNRRDWGNYPLKVHDQTGRLMVLLQWMWELFPARGIESGATIQALWTAFMAEHKRLAFLKPTSFEERVIHYMSRDMHRPLTMMELATTESLSTFQFIRKFKQRTGQTPGQYLQRLRVKRAVALLSTTREPLKVIAQKVGFASVTHLAALIRRETGRLPSAFRARHRA